MASSSSSLRPRWRALDFLLMRPGRIVAPGFEPAPELAGMLKRNIRVLVVGAGGLGCELLKDLALSGFGRLDVIDMDTIDVSNLNRQFLFRPSDVGKPKAEVAARAVAERVGGRVGVEGQEDDDEMEMGEGEGDEEGENFSVVVTPHVGRIEDRPNSWYSKFHLLVLGLDSLDARRHMNSVACSFLEFDDDSEGGEDGGKATPTPTPGTVKPLVDGGTDGFRGHVRVIYPGLTPCFECTLWLFPPQATFPLCTLAETPRSSAHCVEWARLIAWEAERPGTDFDADVEEHMSWVHAKASERAAAFGIPPFSAQHTAGVAKRIVPAIASTNAVVAAACSLEALKAATMLAPALDNYCLFNGGDGAYSAVVSHERDERCPVCSAGVPVSASAARDSLLDLVLELQRIPTVAASLGLDKKEGDKKDGGASSEGRVDTAAGPGEPGSAAAAAVDAKKGQAMLPSSVALGPRVLFGGGAFAAATAGALERKLGELILGGDALPSASFPSRHDLSVNFKVLAAPMRVRLTLNA